MDSQWITSIKLKHPQTIEFLTLITSVMIEPPTKYSNTIERNCWWNYHPQHPFEQSRKVKSKKQRRKTPNILITWKKCSSLTFDCSPLSGKCNVSMIITKFFFINFGFWARRKKNVFFLNRKLFLIICDVPICRFNKNKLDFFHYQKLNENVKTDHSIYRQKCRLSDFFLFFNRYIRWWLFDSMDTHSMLLRGFPMSLLVPAIE